MFVLTMNSANNLRAVRLPDATSSGSSTGYGLVKPGNWIVMGATAFAPVERVAVTSSCTAVTGSAAPFGFSDGAVYPPVIVMVPYFAAHVTSPEVADSADNCINSPGAS